MIKSKETQAVAEAYRAMYEKKVVERASWVPKEITDEGVADFMGAAANAAKAGDKEFEFGGKKYKVTMKKSTVDAITKDESVEEKTECPKCEGEGCDHCDGKGYHTEDIQENLQKVAKDLEKYASQDKKGMDYNDFMKAAKLMKANKGKELGAFTMELDTEPRDKIIDMVKNAVGKAAAEKMFDVKIREEVELDEAVKIKPEKFKGKNKGEKDANTLLTRYGLVYGKTDKMHSFEEPKYIDPKSGISVLITRNGKAFAASKGSQTIQGPTDILKLAKWLEDNGMTRKEEVEESVTKDTDVLEPRAEGEKKFKQMHDDNTEKTDEDDNEEENVKNMTKEVKKAKAN